MKRLILSLLLLFSSSAMLRAEYSDFISPRDRDGTYPEDLSTLGVYVFTSTPALGVVQYASQVAIGTVAIYGILTSTKPTGSDFAPSFVNLRSTLTANTSSELLLPPIEVSSTTKNTFITFDPPVICPGGLSVDVSSTLVIASIFYRQLSTATGYENFWIPNDQNGKKAKSTSFYGVKAGTNVTVGAGTDLASVSMTDYNTSRLPIATVPSLLYGVFVGTTSGQANAFTIFQDTASTVGTTPWALPGLFYNTSTVEDFANSGDRNKTFRFPWPVIFKNGIVVQNSVGTNRIRYFTRPRSTLR